MSEKEARRRRYAPKACTSLLALLHALQGRKLIFELRNDTAVTGRLASVDDGMNCSVEDATWQPLEGPATVLPMVYIKGRTLRMVHMPRQLDPIAAVDAHVEALKAQRRQAAKELLAKRHTRMDKGDGGGGGGAGAGDGGGAGAGGGGGAGAWDSGGGEAGDGSSGGAPGRARARGSQGDGGGDAISGGGGVAGAPG